MIGLYLLIFDMFAVNFAYFFGLWLRFDFRYSQIPPEYLNAFIRFAPFYTVIAIGVFYVLKLYNSLWLFASFDELNRAFAASLITAVVHIAGIRIFVRQMPYSYYLIGAGAAGQVIIRELKNSAESDARPVCVIDDDPQKWGKLMAGIPVVGGRDRIMEAAKEYNADQIMFAIPTASAEAKRDILNICKETGCELMSLPGVYQLTNGDVSVSRMKAVAVEDLLGRDSIKVNMDEIFRYIKGKTILVTGGGGSIGSELCRQIAGHEPKQLIIFDIYENNAYEIEQELKENIKT